MQDPKGTPQNEIARLSKLLTGKLDPALIETGTGKVNEFLARLGSSAPRATQDGKPLLRWQDKLIEEEIPKGASVLDLGCGTGELLSKLMQLKQVRGQGVELEAESVFQCVERGVPVIQADLDSGLKGFPSQGFDYVILEETLQTLYHPVAVLDEMLRVGRHGIVSFPNFAYWRVRLDLGMRGRMPVTEWLPHRWYDTPNIHLFSLQDFLDWAMENDVRILKGHVLAEGQIRPLQPADNLHAEEALLVLEKASGSHSVMFVGS
jgi:methionine biosynthesis protein MetW